MILICAFGFAMCIILGLIICFGFIEKGKRIETIKKLLELTQ